jgi:hypothetical protein
MPITHRVIVSAFVEGATVKSLCRRYGLTELQIEHALRVFLSPSDGPAPVQMDLPEPDPQMTIEEKYGTVEIV